jgi:hypothetical protein
MKDLKRRDEIDTWLFAKLAGEAKEAQEAQEALEK